MTARYWWQEVIGAFKANDIRLVTYVPDRALRPLIDAVNDDNDFRTFATTREEEAVGIVSGAWMGGLRAAVLMQTSGFATLANVIASLAVGYQIPLVMVVSERGTLGEFNIGQALVNRTMRPVLDSLAVESHTISDHGTVGFISTQAIKQAFLTQAPTCLILSPLLTSQVHD